MSESDITEATPPAQPPPPPPAVPLDEIRINAMLASLSNQLMAAINQVVHLTGELAVANGKLDKLKKVLAPPPLPPDTPNVE